MLDYHEFYLTLIRHGQSTSNQNPDLMGQTPDVPLSDKGVKQAQRLWHRLSPEMQQFDEFYCSTYTRAIQTAEIATNYNRKLTQVHDLREYSAGDWTGASRSQTVTLPVGARMGLLNHNFLPPNGESLAQVERRASLWLESEILYNQEKQAKAAELAKTSQVANYYVFSHGMTIKCLLHYILGFDKAMTWKVTIENTSISKLYFGKDGWRLLSINDHAHLSTLWTPSQVV
jgi:broad specificity phosphatase PhoE